MSDIDKVVIVSKQHSPKKQALARTLRREMTPAEDALWQRLRRNQLNGLKFRRQQVIDGFIADFYCHEARLVVKLDGSVHDARQEYDQERDAILMARNLRVIRFSNSQVENDLQGTLAKLAALAEQSENPLLEGGGRG